MTKNKTYTLAEDILEVLNKAYGAPYTFRQIYSRLKYTKVKNPKDLIPVLDQLAEKDKIHKIGRSKYAAKLDIAYITGRVDMKRTGEAYIIPDSFSEDVLVESGMQNRALHGDLVKVALLGKRGKKIKGEIVEIIERTKNQYAGILKVHRDFAFLVTDDRKMHKDIFIPMNKKFQKEWDGMKAIVEISDWPAEAKNPFGEVVKILGKPGENETEMHAIVNEFGFETEFPDEVEKEAAAIPLSLSESEIKSRVDFRKVCTLTIDPETAKDFDDALSVRKLDAEWYEVAVHIADVSHYVPYQSEIDKEALKRGTSVYLVDRTIPMLPAVLSENLCSLVPGKDRPAFSAIFQINMTGKVKQVKFAKSVIHSHKRFSYESAQEVIDKQNGEYLEELNILNNISKSLRKKRFEDGSVNFDSQEFKFNLDENGKPLGIFVKERHDTNFLIEEFMLLANKYVAKFGFNQFENNKRPFVFRYHDKPNDIKLEEFKKFAAKWGYPIKTTSELTTKKSINELMDKIKGLPEEGILSQLAIRSMAKAAYTPNFSSHFGLGFEYYTHFTSPIRRYPDLVVHRMLQEHLSNSKKYTYADILEVETLCKKSSTMEQKAADAERASIKYKQAEWMKDKIGETHEGVITGITDWGIFVELKENKCEGLVKLSSIKDDMYDYDENNMCLVGRYYFRKLSLGDSVKVKIKDANPLSRTIDFSWIDGGNRIVPQQYKPFKNKKRK